MDRFGIRRVVAVALTVIAVGAALTTWMTAPWQLVLSWGVLVGLGSGSMALAFAATVTNRWFVARRGLVTGILTAAGASGQLIFLPLLSWLVEHHGWRPAAVTVSLAALAVVPFVWLLLRDHPADVRLAPYGGEYAEKPAPVTGAARRAVTVLFKAARTGPFWLLAGSFAICGASTNGLVRTHLVPAAHDHGMPVTTAAGLLAVIGVFDVVGTVASGWFTDRFEPRRLLAVYYALRGVSLLFLPMLLAPSVQPPMLFFIVFYGLDWVATVPPTLALCREQYGEDSAIVFGWVLASHQVGAAVVAFAGGVARDVFGTYDVVWYASGAPASRGEPVTGAGAQSTPANLSAPLTAKDRHSGPWSAPRTLTQKAPAPAIRGQVVDVRATMKATRGGSREREAKDWQANPAGPVASSAVTIVTPLAK